MRQDLVIYRKDNIRFCKQISNGNLQAKTREKIEKWMDESKSRGAVHGHFALCLGSAKTKKKRRAFKDSLIVLTIKFACTVDVVITQTIILQVL